MAAGPNSCGGCGASGAEVEVRWSCAAQLPLCEPCFCRLPVSRYVPTRGRVVRLPPPPRPAPPSAYARLHTRVYEALQRAGEAVTGEHWCVFGLGDPELPLCGYCPVCSVGTVAIRLLDTDPPRLRTDGCSNGCSPELLWGVI